MVTKRQTRELLGLCGDLLNDASSMSIALFDAKALPLESRDESHEFRRRVRAAHEVAEQLCAELQAMQNAALTLDANADTS
jgi:hypothetical protein